jgi:hypothetical protein
MSPWLTRRPFAHRSALRGASRALGRFSSKDLRASLDVGREGGVARVSPHWLGEYRITVDGHTELRVAQVDAREVDLRPRAVAAGSAGAEATGQRRELVDVSGYVALVLLVLLSLEMALRLSSRSTTARAV